jgi:NAD(P)-dependent dehydrogenase (short-subunit alcohol dehydrogenase family)
LAQNLRPMSHAEEAHESTVPAAPPAVRGAPPGRRRAIVVGASSGIGEALVRRLAAEGYSVFALARRADALAGLETSAGVVARALGGWVRGVAHDVRDSAEVPALFERLVRELGGLDLFVFAAGVMPKVGRDEYDTEQDLEMLSINFGGCVAWCNEVARLYSTQRSGVLVGISSIAGVRGRKGNPMYGSTKAAMTHYLESLRNRLAERGAHVCTILPGYVDTVMTQGLKTFWLISADQAAKTILWCARRGVNERFVPWRWGLVALVLRLIPSAIFRKLNF